MAVAPSQPQATTRRAETVALWTGIASWTVMAAAGPVRARESVLAETIPQRLQKVRRTARSGELIAIGQGRGQ